MSLKSFLASKLSTWLYERQPMDTWAPRVRKADITIEGVSSALSSWKFGDPRSIADVIDLLKTDPFVKGVVRQWIAGVLSVKTEIRAAGEDDDQKQVADEIRAAWEDATTNRHGMLAGLLESGPGRGGGFVEVMWSSPTEPGPRRWTAFRTVPQQRVRFDEKTGQPCLAENEFSYRGVPVETYGVGKFIRAIVDEEITDFSKRGTYRVVIDEWIARTQTKGNWNQNVEQFGSPIGVAQSDNAEDREALKAYARERGSFAQAVVSKDTVLSFLEASRSGTVSPYEARLKHSREEIAIAFLGQSQTTVVGTTEGSQSSAKVHEGVASDVMFAMWTWMSGVIMRDLFGAYVAINYGPENVSRLTPRLEPRLEGLVDLEKLVRALDVAKNRLGRKIPAKWFTDVTGIPDMAPGDAELGEGFTPKAAPALVPDSQADPNERPAPDKKQTATVATFRGRR